jgi:hypothetical protein
LPEAVYIVLVARAIPSLSLDHIRYYLPLAQGHAYIHTASILEGAVMIWPDARLSRRGRWWLKVTELFRSRRAV